VSGVELTRGRLSGRIVRSLALARERMAAADLLNFYADLCEFQQSLLRHHRTVVRSSARKFAAALDAPTASTLAVDVVRWLDDRPQQGLVNLSRTVRGRTKGEWEPLLDRCWRSGGVSLDGVEESDQFVAEALLQPFAESLTRSREGAGPGSGMECRTCGGRAFLATRRERGGVATRTLLCGFCLSEWQASPTACPACGKDEGAVLVYRSEEFPDVRIEACRNCDSYVKTIDLTHSMDAVPIVDDLASLAMDLWAAGRGYRKLRPNLLRL
jgi:formate dehydrogenase maturation protein FdhE